MIKDYNQLIVSVDQHVSHALQILDETGSGIVLVCDDNSLLQGVITNGDLRRQITLGASLISECVTSVMQKKFISAEEKCDKEQAMQIMLQHGLQHLPVLSSKGRLVGLRFLDDFLAIAKQLANPVVIMAGGLGTRLGQLTVDTPKPMLLIKGRPLLEILVAKLRSCGFTNIYLSVGYRKDQIKAHFRDGSDFGVNINYLEEDFPLGTAGALRKMIGLLSLPVVVVNGDILSKIDFAELVSEHNKDKARDASIGLRSYKVAIPYGVVDLVEDKVIQFLEKPLIEKYVNAGIYVFNPDLLSEIPSGVDFGMDSFLNVLLEKGYEIKGFRISDYWIDIGSPSTFHDAQQSWLEE
ncbi:sugar phosphate nucleotidyltransferase [Litorivicinus sp.]|nr:sugar phosphate nucleotidyltransferase [Litorivicinus sp.]